MTGGSARLPPARLEPKGRNGRGFTWGARAIRLSRGEDMVLPLKYSSARARGPRSSRPHAGSGREPPQRLLGALVHQGRLHLLRGEPIGRDGEHDGRGAVLVAGGVAQETPPTL